MVEKKDNPLEGIFRSVEEKDDVDINETKETIKEWLNKKNIHLKTELNQQQIHAVTILKSLADQYDIKPLKKLLENFLCYMLSKNRQSSKELVEMLKNKLGLEDESDLGALAKFLE